MELGDIPAWVACVLAAAAFIVSWKARGDGKRSATASERSAKTAEDALALQRREAEERRQAEAEAARPRVQLRLEHVNKDAYRLCNDGTAPARNIVFDDEELPAVFRLRGTGEVSLEAHEAIEFLMAGSMGKPLPPQLFAKWDGQDAYVPLRVPPKM
ncbi:hypothetical protein [Streptomyces sp. STCH 565 A]|uniref:hypothetical protein n=1 Tax=Streptomyces sp. STCH 565 A TaxID=2950532 RepID=UPI002075192B|nr:hypothetical protein [Streptomyces sp. STCH 565 A]MCM8555376.1 hypothetical protein [Streptomyces sp. STCH 565 A]